MADCGVSHRYLHADPVTLPFCADEDEAQKMTTKAKGKVKKYFDTAVNAVDIFMTLLPFLHMTVITLFFCVLRPRPIVARTAEFAAIDGAHG